MSKPVVDAGLALKESTRDLREIKHALDQSAIVAMTNIQGDITFVNEKFCEISKYSAEELLGRNHRILNSGLHPIEFFKEMYRTIANGRVWRGEIRNRAKDGSLYWVDTTIVPFLHPDGRPRQYIAIRYDITERKRSEAALREQTALAQLGKMAAVVAHEVRNPLAGIRGAMQVLGRRLPESSAEHGVVTEVVRRIDTLNDIVQDLLQFARPHQPTLRSFPVSTLIAGTISLLREDPRFAGVDIEVAVEDHNLVGDLEQLKLVLVNLLINSAQAMPGRGIIRVMAGLSEGWHEVRVIDQGPGIPVEARAHLFEPFFTTKHRGTGLGLATARRILESHRGTIAFEFPPAGGTVAIVRLPMTSDFVVDAAAGPE
jgi:PAS domain S-box-containing protein